jgi:hypothetical protein
VAPTGYGNRVAVVPGVDWRGERGYVVAPPSWHASGRPYRWVRPLRMPAPACPEPLRRLLAPRPAPEQRFGAGPPVPVRHPDRYVAAAMRNERERVAAAPVGQRNNILYRAARGLGELAAAGLLTEGEVYRTLTPAARSAGLPAVEVARTVASGLAAGRRHPRAAA